MDRNQPAKIFDATRRIRQKQLSEICTFNREVINPVSMLNDNIHLEITAASLKIADNGADDVDLLLAQYTYLLAALQLQVDDLEDLIGHINNMNRE